MKKIVLIISTLVLFLSTILRAQELLLGTAAQDSIVNVTNAGITVVFSVLPVSVTVINYDATDNVYITWDGSLPDAVGTAGANNYVLPPNFEKTKWIRANRVYLRTSGTEEALVGIEWDY